jgi:transglutaminase-like putative cysteine protease
MMRRFIPRLSVPSAGAPGAGRACVRWSFALLALALASHAPALAPMAWLALVLALCSRALPQRDWAALLRLALLAVTLVVGGLLHGWLDAHTLRLALLCVLALKWAEARRPGEFALLACAAPVAGAIGLLQWGEWMGLMLIVLLPLLALRSLSAVTEVETGGTQRERAGAWLRALAPLRGEWLRLALALPLAAALFVFFPRIPGPLWDIGLSFGLPLSLGLEKSSQGLGVSTRLKPGQGQVQTGVAESHPVLVAEFENWVPPMALLYWRGPVYYDFDGHEWRLDPVYEEGQGRTLMRRGWTKAAAFSDTLAKKTHEITYMVRLTPHDRLWLYGLDLPAGLAAESFVSTDWQVLAHRPVTTETSYQLKSWLEWEAGGALDEETRRRALALPERGNPRLRALGAELAGQPPEERFMSVLTALAKDGYKVREQFELHEGEDAFDHVWFASREGNANLYSGAVVFLMRAAGLPARLVTGYRGGKLMALTDYVIVKKSHAHAWVEVWSETRGWQRIDPVDLIAPSGSGSAGQPVAPRPRPAPASTPAAPKPDEAPRQAPAPGMQERLPASTSAPTAAPTGWRLSALDDFFGRWIFRLDGAAQQSLLAGLGDKLGDRLGKTLGGKFAWVWLLIGAALASATVMAVSRCVVWLREARRLPMPQREWNRIVRLLARRGFRPGVWESPGGFAHRVSAARPLWAESVTALARAYADWRYAPTPTDAAARIRGIARKLYNLILSEATGPRPSGRAASS